MVYEIVDFVVLIFIQYINICIVDELGGDLVLEDIVFIDVVDSLDGKVYIVVFYEVSGIVGIFELQMQFIVIFVDNFIIVEEGSGVLQLEIVVEQVGGLMGKVVVNIFVGFIVIEGIDFILVFIEVEFDGINMFQFFFFDIFDNMELGGQYIVIEIDVVESEVKLGEIICYIVCIIDNDDMVFVVVINFELQLIYFGSYFIGGGEGMVEIVVFDGEISCLFFINGENNQVDIFDYSNLVVIILIFFIDIFVYGVGINFVVVSNGIVVVVIEVDVVDGVGMVVFFDMDGNFLNVVEVGVLFDMVIFIFDGIKAFIVNEGEFNGDYDVDLLGFVSIIDFSGGVVVVMVIMLGFEVFNDQQVVL